MRAYFFACTVLVSTLCTNLFIIHAQVPVKFEMKEVDFTAPNMTDQNGNKMGLWIETPDENYKTKYYTFCFYIDNKKNGVELTYTNWGSGDKYWLEWLITYKNNIMNGYYIMFNRDGSINFYIDRIGPNVDFLEDAKQYGYFYPEATTSQAYVYFYDPEDSTKLRSEGWVIFDFDCILNSTCQDVGVTKIYNDDNTITYKQNIPYKRYGPYSKTDSINHRKEIIRWMSGEKESVIPN